MFDSPPQDFLKPFQVVNRKPRPLIVVFQVDYPLLSNPFHQFNPVLGDVPRFHGITLGTTGVDLEKIKG